MKKIIGILALASALLASCGTTNGSTDDHNDADVAFVSEMIPHHRQAVMMSAMAAGASTTASVEDLAGRIEKAQESEIDLMSGWLERWGEGSGSMMDGDMMDGDGMMSGATMMQLGSLEGEAFAELWLELMIEHHEGAITMAERVLADGQSSDVKQLATSIIDTQTEEITQMKAMS